MQQQNFALNDAPLKRSLLSHQDHAKLHIGLQCLQEELERYRYCLSLYRDGYVVLLFGALIAAQDFHVNRCSDQLTDLAILFRVRRELT